jgi:hypothetical protein
MAYKESLLQWIWQELQFNCSDLRTTSGESIEIRDNGTLNHGAGPDFLGAHLFIDGLEWHGSVEIHKTAKEWFRHGHHRDKNFNNVVLHVVGNDKGLCTVETLSRSKPFTLCLRPYLQRGLNELLVSSKERSIPCAGNIEFIHQEVFEQQVEVAHKEYFDFKVNDLVQLYPAGEPLTRAWKQAFIHQVYRTLGISANREQMSELGVRVAASDCSAHDLQGWQNAVYSAAFETESSVETICWATTGIRPSGKPQVRVKQAAAFQYAAASLSPRDYLEGPEHAWNKIQEMIPGNSKPGRLMNRLIYYTAFIPAVYLLGKLLHDKLLMNASYSCWKDQAVFVPESMQEPFKKAGFEVNGKVKKLGLAHQYKRYCKKNNCRECKVFKNAIRA